MLTQKIKDILTWVCEKQGYSLPSSDNEYFKVLWKCGKIVSELDRDSHRWWDTLTIVKQFDLEPQGIYYIGYEWAYANRDQSIFDLGWQFDQGTISLYKPKEIVTTTYVETMQDQL